MENGLSADLEADHKDLLFMLENKMTQGFDDAFKKISKVNLKTHTELWGEPKTEKLYFEAGAASRQAEIDELKIKIMTIESTRKQLIDMKNLNIDALHVENERIQKEYQALFNELEILQGMHNAVSLTAGELVDERDELQKRIDRAEKLMSLFFKEDSYEYAISAHDVLKGDSNE